VSDAIYSDFLFGFLDCFKLVFGNVTRCFLIKKNIYIYIYI